MSNFDKKHLTERDICTKCITPAIKRAGWDEMLQIREEVSFTKGRKIPNLTAFASGEETPTASLKGLRANMAEGDGFPVEVPPPPSPRKYWTPKAIAEWLVERLAEDVPTLVGIDHSFSFPLRHFETHGLLPDWRASSPISSDPGRPTEIIPMLAGNGAARMGNVRWQRLTKERAGGA